MAGKRPNVGNINLTLQGTSAIKRPRYTPGTPADQINEINDRISKIEQSVEELHSKVDKCLTVLDALMKTCVTPPLIVPSPTVQFKPTTALWKRLRDEPGEDTSK